MYTRYEPWINSSFFAGVLRFESGGKIFRISRNFHKNSIKEELICETDGERLAIEQGDLAVLLGNVSESAFDNTISIGQLKSHTDEGLSLELRNYMANYEGSSDGELDVGKALNILKRKKKECENQQKLTRAGQNKYKAEMCARMEYIREELRTYQKQLDQLEQECRNQKKHCQESTDVKKSETQTGTRRMPAVLGIVAIMAAAAGIIFRQGRGALAAAFVSAGCAVAAYILLKGRRHKKAGSGVVLPAAPADEARERLKHLEGRYRQLQELHEEKKTQLANLQTDYLEYEERIRVFDPNEEEILAIQLAMEEIEQLSLNMQKHLEKELHHRISEIFKELTLTQYTHVDISEGQEIGLHSQEHYLPLQMASKGTIEQLYFSLRMAAAELLCGEEEIPVLLDDVFAMYDDERLAAALQWLACNKEQVLIFTCQNRELELVKKLGMPVNIILL